MSFSIQRAVSDGSMVLLPISIEYFDRSEISVLFDGVADARQWAWVGTTDTSISFTPAVANLVEVSVRRSTDISEPRHQFSQGAQFTTESLDEDIRQVLHIAQEAKEGSGLGEVYQDLNFHGFKATNMGNGSLPGDAVNHAQMQVHDATIVGYKDAAQASAVAAAASAASIDVNLFAHKDGVGTSGTWPISVTGNAATATTATTATTAANLLGRVQLGASDTATQNFTLTAEAANGTMKLARGNAGATTQDILTVDAAGKPDFPQLVRTLGPSGSYTLPGGLILKWGVVNTSAGADTTVVFPAAFPTTVFGVFGQQPATLQISLVVVPGSVNTAQFACNSLSSGGRNALTAYWFAIGN